MANPPIPLINASGQVKPIVSAAADGQLIIGDGSTGGFDVATLTAGTNITITVGHGTITIAAAAGSGPLTLVSSTSLGSVTTFNITGLNTLTNDYKMSIRAVRGGGGAAADYITIQSGSTGGSPTWFTDTMFMTVLGASPGTLTTAGGITRIAQVQNNGTLHMGTELSFDFSDDGTVLNLLAHSYFWENIVQVDQTASGQIGAFRFTFPNQAWTASYSLYSLTK